ncbi:MAG: hypothetical protein JEY99_03330 [Spirochaetales bacterium]|nr:hypothetical protein [Spirochaetales bacterium]
MKLTKSPSLILMGMKHTGKSTLGRTIAKKRNLPFYDLDDLLEKEAQKMGRDFPESVRPVCREIYRYSKDLFQKLELMAGEMAASIMEKETIVLALGGGAIENRGLMEILKAAGRLIFLDESADLLYERIIRGGIPSFLDPENPKGSFLTIYEKRCALYYETAETVVKLRGASLMGALELLEENL